MSRWTHVNGSFQLSASPYTRMKLKNGKERVILKYPSEQFLLSQPKLNDGKMEFSVYIYSLPKVKPIIEKYIKNLMPRGESHFNYFLNQDPRDFRTSCSGFDYRCQETLFKKLLKERYTKDPYNLGYFECFQEEFDYGWIQECSDFTFTVSDNIRYCSGYRLMDAFERLFDSFSKEHIWVDCGVIEWTDEYERNLIFSIRQLPCSNELVFKIFDKRKNKSLAKKTILYDYVDDKSRVVCSDNWEYLMRGHDE